MDQPQLFDLARAAVGDPAQPPRPPRPRWHYEHLEAFVVGFIAPIYLVRLDSDPGRTWCAKWWSHAEAKMRLTVCWHAWEDARLHKEKAPDMWRELDYHMDILWSPGGPFRNCQVALADAPAVHRSEPPPSLVTAPDGTWSDT